MTDLSTIRAWLADPTAPPDEACGYVAELLSEIDRLKAERATLSAPVEGVDVEEVLRLDREATAAPWNSDDNADCWRLHGSGIADGCVQILKAPKHSTPFAEYWPPIPDAVLITTYRTAAPALAREVVALRAELDDESRAFPTFRHLVERTAAALGLDKERVDPETGEPYLPSWHDIPEQVECLIKERNAALAEAGELRRAEAAALFLPEGGADLGFLMPEAGLWWKPADDGSIEIEDFTRCTHPDGKPFRRAHYRNGETLSSSFHATPRAAMRAETP